MRHVSWFADVARASGVGLERPDWASDSLFSSSTSRTSARPSLGRNGEACARRTRSRSPPQSARGTSCAGATPRRRRSSDGHSCSSRRIHSRPPFSGIGSRESYASRGGRTSRSMHSAQRSGRSRRSPTEARRGGGAGWSLDLATFFYFENAQDELAELVRTLEPLVEQHGTLDQRLDLLPAPPRPARVPARALCPIRRDRGARPGDVPDGSGAGRRHGGLHTRVLPPLERQAQGGGRVLRARARGRSRTRLCAYRDAMPRLSRFLRFAVANLGDVERGRDAVHEAFVRRNQVARRLSRPGTSRILAVADSRERLHGREEASSRADRRLAATDERR